MPLLIIELIFGDVNTISIPSDAIIIVAVLILLTLLGYLYNNILSNETNQITQKIDIESTIEVAQKKLNAQLPLNAITLDQKNLEKACVKKLNLFLKPSKLLNLGSLAVLALGGTTLLGLQNLQKSYKGANTNQPNIKVVKQTNKSPISIMNLKSLDTTQSHIKRISYFDPLFSTIKSSKDNHYFQVKEKQIENNFSF